MSDNSWPYQRNPYSKPLTPKEQAFLDDIRAVCRKHNMSIAHQDGGGAFIIEPYEESDLQWLYDCNTIAEEV
jgi:hypothetical protein